MIEDTTNLDRQTIYRMMRACQMKAWDAISTVEQNERRVWAVKNQIKDLFAIARHRISDIIENDHNNNRYVAIKRAIEDELLSTKSMFYTTLNNILEVAYESQQKRDFIAMAITSFHFITAKGEQDYLAYRKKIAESIDNF